MTMSLDVTVKLIDQLSRPARGVDEALNRLATTSKKFSGSAGAAATKNLMGLGKAFKAISDNAPKADVTSRVERFSKALVDLSTAAPGIRAASLAVNALGRSLDRFSASTSKLAAATTAVRNFNKAVSATPPAGSGAAAHLASQLQSVIQLQNQAIANMNRLNRSGGGGRPGRGGGGGGGGGNGGGNGFGSGYGYGYDMHAVGGIARHGFTATMNAEDAVTRARSLFIGEAAGVAEKNVNKIKLKAQQMADENTSTTYAGNISAIIEARSALSGDLEKALDFAPFMAKIGTLLAKQGTELDKIKASKDAVYAALRSGELLNIVGDEKKLKGLMGAIVASSAVTEGRVTPQLWASNIQMAKSAGLSLSDSFVTSGAMPFLMAELTNAGKGSRSGVAGNALMSSYSAIVQNRISKKSVPEWVAAGQFNEGDVQKDGNLKPGARAAGVSTFMKDPQQFFAELMKNFESRGIVSTQDKLEHISLMYGNRVAAGFADIMSLQQGRLAGFIASMRAAGNGQEGSVDKALGLWNNTASHNVEKLQATYNDLLTTTMGPFLPIMTTFIEGLGWGAKQSKSFIGQMFGVGSDPNDPNSMGTGTRAALAGGTLLAGVASFAAVAARWPAAATLMGQAFVAVVTGSPLAAFMARSTVAAVVASIGGAVTGGLITTLATSVGGILTASLSLIVAPAGLAIAAAIVAGLAGVGLMKHFAPQMAAFADRNKSQEQKQSETTEMRKRLREDRAIIGNDDTSMFRRAATRLDAASAENWFKARGLSETDEFQPLAGKRAAGGAVDRQKSYLVGERGPEIFTPGVNGGITSNRMLNGLAGSGDTDTPKAIGYLSFQLASAVEGISRSIDRLGARGSIGEDGDSGDGSGSSGSGGSGRRGFMGRGGHFGGGRRAFMAQNALGSGRRGFMERGAHGDGSFNSGPRVALGQMRAGGKGAYGKFDSKAPAIMAGLMAKYGLTHEQAAGVVGNLGHESARFTAYHEGGKVGGKGGVGWAQWTGSRRRKFEAWTKAHGLNPTSDEASWRFLTEGDPETAGAMEAVKQTHNSNDAVRAFHDHFERSADIRHGRIIKQGSWNSRLNLANRANGMGAAPADRVPEALREQAKQQKQTADQQSRSQATGGDTHHHYHGDFNMPIHAAPHHDERKIADAVHTRFKRAVDTQLSDGAYG